MYTQRKRAITASAIGGPRLTAASPSLRRRRAACGKRRWAACCARVFACACECVAIVFCVCVAPRQIEGTGQESHGRALHGVQVHMYGTSACACCHCTPGITRPPARPLLHHILRTFPPSSPLAPCKSWAESLLQSIDLQNRQPSTRHTPKSLSRRVPRICFTLSYLPNIEHDYFYTTWRGQPPSLPKMPHGPGLSKLRQPPKGCRVNLV